MRIYCKITKSIFKLTIMLNFTLVSILQNIRMMPPTHRLSQYTLCDLF